MRANRNYILQPTIVASTETKDCVQMVLKKMVEELNSLSEHGLEVTIRGTPKRVSVTVVAICGDLPSVAKMLGSKFRA